MPVTMPSSYEERKVIPYHVAPLEPEGSLRGDPWPDQDNIGRKGSIELSE